MRVELYFSSAPAFRTIANASVTLGGLGQAFQAEVGRLRVQSGIRTEGDAWLGQWDVPLAMGPSDPPMIAEFLVEQAKRAWNGLCAPVLGGGAG